MRLFRMGRGEKDPYLVSRSSYVADAALEYFQALLLSGAYLAKLTQSLGISDSLTGILTSVVALGCAFKLLSVYLFPKQPVKGRVMIFELLNQVLTFALYLIPLWGGPGSLGVGLFAAVLVLRAIMLNACFPAKVTWMMGLVDDQKRGRFTAVKEMVSLISGVAFTYTMGGVIDRYEAMGNTPGAFRICVLVIVGLLVIRMGLLFICKEKPAPPLRKETALGMRDVLRQPMMRKLILLNILIFAAEYITVPFLGTYQTGELGFSMTLIAIISFGGSMMRILASFYLGSVADKKGFAAMLRICFGLMGAAFLANMFTVPANGKVMYLIYTALYSMAMGGVNSASTNLAFDYALPEQRSAVLSVYSSVGGLAGFLATLLVSPLVAHIQASGNQLFGLPVYAQQVMSACSAILMGVLLVYLTKVIMPMKQAGKLSVSE